MLDESPKNNKALVDALRAWHKDERRQPPVDLGITKNPENTIWDIPYGSDGTKYGTIRMKRNNFEVAEATKSDGKFAAFPYNHSWPATLSKTSISNALRCKDLTAPDKAELRSILILLTSEAARSMLVQRFVIAVLLEKKDLTDAHYRTVQGLTREYAHTQKCVPREVGPGPDWAPLKTEDHLKYAKQQKDKNFVHDLEGIGELKSFLEVALKGV